MNTEETPGVNAQPVQPTKSEPAQAQAAQPPSVPQPAERLRPRSGPIVGGTLLLVLCAYVIVQQASGPLDAKTWFIATILGLGALLLLVGIAVLVRGPHERR